MKSVTIYTRRKCCLCAQALDLLEKLEDKVKFELLVVDIDRDLLKTDPRLSRLAIEVPVVEVDGQEVFRYEVDEAAFLDLLSRNGN